MQNPNRFLTRAYNLDEIYEKPEVVKNQQVKEFPQINYSTKITS